MALRRVVRRILDRATQYAEVPLPSQALTLVTRLRARVASGDSIAYLIGNGEGEREQDVCVCGGGRMLCVRGADSASEKIAQASLLRFGARTWDRIDPRGFAVGSRVVLGRAPAAVAFLGDDNRASRPRVVVLGGRGERGERRLGVGRGVVSLRLGAREDGEEASGAHDGSRASRSGGRSEDAEEG